MWLRFVPVGSSRTPTKSAAAAPVMTAIRRQSTPAGPRVASGFVIGACAPRIPSAPTRSRPPSS